MKNGGVLDVETKIISGIDNFAPGYIDKENEVIVGLQTDAPLKAHRQPLRRHAHGQVAALEQYGYTAGPRRSKRTFTEYRKTHNDGVFDAYPKRIRASAPRRASHRPAGCLRPRPHHRRLPPCGAVRHRFPDRAERRRIWTTLDGPMTDERIRLREEVTHADPRPGRDQVHGRCVTAWIFPSPAEQCAARPFRPCTMAYLAGIKENNGAATSPRPHFHLP